MAEYRWDNSELQGLVQEVMNDEKYPELEDLRAYPPVIAVAEVHYDDDNLFERAAQKSLGKTPCWIVKCNDTVRSLTGGNGVMKGFNDEAQGVEFFIKVDPARFNNFPEHAQRGHIFNLLTQLRLKKAEDNDTGEMIPVESDGRPVWDVNKHQRIGFQTIRRFGRIDEASARMLEAAQAAHKDQLHLFDYQPSLPKSEELEDGVDGLMGEGAEEPREVGEEDPEIAE